MPAPVTVKIRRVSSPRLFFGYYFFDMTSDYKAMLITVHLQRVFREQQGANTMLHTAYEEDPRRHVRNLSSCV